MFGTFEFLLSWIDTALGVDTGRVGIEKRPFADKDRNVFVNRGNLITNLVHGFFISSWIQFSAFHFSDHQILVSIQDHVFKIIFGKEGMSFAEIKAIVEHDYLVVRQNGPQNLIGPLIKVI